MTLHNGDNSCKHVNDDEGGDDFTMKIHFQSTVLASFVHTNVIYIVLVHRFLVQTVTYICLFLSLIGTAESGAHYQ